MAETTAVEFHIDEYLFERQFARFRNHVIGKSGRDFVSFTSNHYTDKEEGYKYGVHHEGRQTLGLDEWRQTDIGKGKILRSVIAAIELKESNLLKWQGRWGEKSKPHHKLIEALSVPPTKRRYEELLFRLYNGNDDPLVFDSLVVLSGRRYPVLSYLFFLKDRSRYMPIAPTFFDGAFEMLGPISLRATNAHGRTIRLTTAFCCKPNTCCRKSLTKSRFWMRTHLPGCWQPN